jgi:hypothetical protein
MPPQDELYKGMTPRDMLVLIYESLERMRQHNEANEDRIAALEKDLLQFKTETTTRMRVVIAGVSAVVTILSIVISLVSK